MPRTATRTRARRANPPQSEALLAFCRHCETIFEPASSPIQDVCPSCAEARYAQCDHCGSYHPAEGMRSHDTSTCGLHVHVSRDFFGKTGIAQELTELKLIETVDRLFEPIIYFSRRKREQINRWAPRCNAPKSDGGWMTKAKSVSRYAKGDRYHAVNITNEHTIEFRMFRGTLKADTILATLQFVSGLCHLVKASNPSQMDRLGWYELCDAVIEHCPTDSSELYNYLIERELICMEGE